MTAQVEVLGQPAFRASLRDVSAGGCKFISPRTIEKDEILLLTIPVVGEQLGYVVWCDRGQCGVRFDRPIDADKVVGRTDPAYRFAPAEAVSLEHWRAPVVH